MAQVDFAYTKGHDVSVIHIELIAQAPLSEVHKVSLAHLHGKVDALQMQSVHNGRASVPFAAAFPNAHVDLRPETNTERNLRRCRSRK